MTLTAALAVLIILSILIAVMPKNTSLKAVAACQGGQLATTSTLFVHSLLEAVNTDEASLPTVLYIMWALTSMFVAKALSKTLAIPENP